jgi:predicted nucleic acid-binding protein
MMPFVLDASIAACWEDPRADLARAKIRTDEAVVPSLWWFEIRNILVVNERKKRITEPDTAVFLRDISSLKIRIDRDPQEAGILRLARAHRLTAYDAAYLELALRERIPLATLDKSLSAAARSEQARFLEDE